MSKPSAHLKIKKFFLRELTKFNAHRKELQINLNKSAIIVIDMQEFFCNQESHAYVKQSVKITSCIKKLLEIYRSNKRPIIFTYHAYKQSEDQGVMSKWWDDNICEENPFSSIIADFKRERGDKIIRKTRYSAFCRTDLDSYLKKKGCKQLLITGVMTHLCVESTVRDGFMRDYEIFIPYDCTASHENKFHYFSLLNLAHGFSKIKSTKELIRELS